MYLCMIMHISSPGGSGITPMYQLAVEVVNDPNDNTKVTIIMASSSDRDVLLKSQLNSLESLGASVVHVISNNTGSIPGSKSGRITKELLASLLPEDSFVCVCGTVPFYQAISGGKGPNFTQGAVGGFLQELGYGSDKVFKI